MASLRTSIEHPIRNIDEFVLVRFRSGGESNAEYSQLMRPLSTFIFLVLGVISCVFWRLKHC